MNASEISNNFSLFFATTRKFCKVKESVQWFKFEVLKISSFHLFSSFLSFSTNVTTRRINLHYFKFKSLWSTTMARWKWLSTALSIIAIITEIISLILKKLYTFWLICDVVWKGTVILLLNLDLETFLLFLRLILSIWWTLIFRTVWSI